MAIKPRDLKYKPLSRGDEFDKARLKQDIETSQLIRELDISSREGLGKYAEMIVGDKNALDNASPESIDASRNYVLSEHAMYEVANAGKMLDSLEDSVAANAFVFNPKMRLHQGNGTSFQDGSYNAIVNTIQEGHKRQEELKDPQKQRQILARELEGLNDYVKGFWINFAEDVLRGYIQGSFDDAQQKLRQYGGAKKFAGDQVKVMKTLAEEQGQKKKDLSDKVQKALEEKKKELGRNPNAGERAEIFEQFKKESKEIQEKYGNVGEDLARYVSVLESAWYQTNFPQKPETNPAQNPQDQGRPDSSD